MKTLSLLLVATFFTFHFAQAQYCYGQLATCSPSGSLTNPGFSPLSEMQPAIVTGTASTTVIQFKNYDTARYQGNLVTVQKLRIDSIGNLPTGLCWVANAANRTYNNQQTGCINVVGSTNAPIGQYKLYIRLALDIGLGVFIPVNAADLGLHYYLRVISPGMNTPCIDSSGQRTFIPYAGNEPTCNFSPFSTSLGADQIVCNGTSRTLSPALSGGQAPYTYAWSATGNSLSCNNCASPSTTITQNSVFSVTITDANSLVATDSVVYTLASGNLQITPSGPTTFCQGGSVTLRIPAGYSSYLWSNNSTASSITVTQTSTYSVSATALGGCTSTGSIAITSSSPVPNYQITANGPTTFCRGDSVVLDAGSGYTSYYWNTNAATQTITVTNAGTYAVTALGADGCTYLDVEHVFTDTAYHTHDICIVSVDPVSGKNVIVWEKNPTYGVDSFIIYRETNIANTFLRLHSQAYADFSTYEDVQSNPQQQSYRYVITTMAQCGESNYSSAHKTIHLTSNVGINNEVNLIWSDYEGLSYPSFNIYRGSSQSNLTLLTSVSSSTNSYTDLTPPPPPVFYQIEVVNPNGCVPTAKNEGYSSSMSNIIQLTALSIETNVADVISMYSYYDAGNGENVLQLNYNNQASASLKLYDISGRVVFELSRIASGKILLPATLSKGIYAAEVTVGMLSARDKISIR